MPLKNPTLYPFLFKVSSSKSFQESFGPSKFVDQDEWWVKIARFDYSIYDSSWMDDEDLGETVMTPDVDICEEKYCFPSEKDALSFIANWWKDQIE